MKNTIPNIIISILNIRDKIFVDKKLSTIENQLILNEVESKIIADIKEKLYVDQLVSVEYIKEKYSYAIETESILGNNNINREAIDSVISEIRVNQLKHSLSKELLSLASQINTMSPKDIKLKVSELHNNTLIETKIKAAENAISKKADPYGDLIASRDGLNLVLPIIEKHAGKASKGTTVAILAATGHYKTAYALNIAYQNAMQGKNMLYLTLEDTGKKLEMRLALHHIASTTKDDAKLIEAEWVRDGLLTPELKEVYNNKHNEMVEQLDNHLIIWDTQDFSYETFLDMETTLRAADKMFLEETGTGLDAVFIDHVSLLKYTKGSGKSYSYDGAVINDWMLFMNNQSLNFLEEDRQITFFALSQIKRDAVEDASKPRKKGRYGISCAADASEIEHISTTMITLFKDPDVRDTLLINLPKAREGFQPEHPIQAEVHGEYFHIGPLEADVARGRSISLGDFNKSEFDIESLIKGD